MQQDGRKKRMSKCLCVTNVTGLLLSCSVVIFSQELICFGLLQKDKTCLKKDEVWGKFFQTKLVSRLSHKICRCFCSPVLLHKFTNNVKKNRGNFLFSWLHKLGQSSQSEHRTCFILPARGLSHIMSQSVFPRHMTGYQWCQLSRFWRETYAFLPHLLLSRFGTYISRFLCSL